jgi:hypothetical protein
MDLTDENLCVPLKKDESRTLGDKLKKIWLDAEGFHGTIWMRVCPQGTDGLFC